MKQLFKSFFKFNTVKTIQTVSFIIFIFLFSGITLGLVSTPIQIINIANKVDKQERKWDYSWESYWDLYNGEFLYNYFQKNDGKDNYLKTSLLNLTLDVNGETLESYLNQYYSLNVDKYKNYETFAGSFIRDNVFHFRYLYEHKVLLPPLYETATLVNFGELVKEKWKKESYENYGQVYRLINKDLKRLWNIKDVEIDSNFIFSYTWANYGEQRTKFNLEPINLGQTDNVVLLKGDKNALLNMKDNEIIINDKYANLHQLKIGDFLTLNNYINEDGSSLSFGRYKIIGFGTKINNLFSNDILSNSNYNSEVYCYLTNNEISKYINYLYKTDNVVIFPNHKKENQNQVFLKTRLIGSNSAIKSFANILKKESVLNNDLDLKKYSQEDFSLILNMYLIEALLFIIIGMTLLICSILFINYCLKKELTFIATTIGILKANGYSGIEMASIFWIKVLVMLLMGFTIGFFVSLPLQVFVHGIITMNSFVLINKILLNWLFIFSAVFLLPLFLSFINFISLVFYLKSSPIKLASDQQISKKFIFKNKKYWKTWKPFHSFLFLKSTKKTSIVVTVLSLSFLAFCFEINSKHFMISLTDEWTPVYQKIDSSFNNGYKFNWKKDDKDLTFDNFDKYNINFDYYDHVDYINQQIDKEIENMITEYLMIDDNSATEALLNILNENFNQKTTKISSLEKLMLKVVDDYKKGNINLPIEEVVKQINENWIPQFDILNKKIIQKDITISFNKMFIKNGIDFPIYKLDLNNNSYEFSSYTEWKLILLSDYSMSAFKWKGITSEILSNWKNKNTDYYPVLVTQHFAQLNNLKIGDIFEANLVKSHEDSSLKMVIQGINRSDIYTNNIYGYYDLFINSFTNLIGKETFLINEILTKQNTLIFSKNFTDFKINSNYFSFFTPELPNAKISLLKLLSNPEQLYDFITWNSFGQEKYSNYNLQIQITKSKNDNFGNLMNLIAISTFLILTILFLVLTLVSFLEVKQYLSVLKALGVNNFILNLNLNFRTFFGLIFACTIGVIINYFIWKIIVQILFDKAKIVIFSPFNWNVILLGIIIISFIFLLGLLITEILIKKMKIT